MRLQPDAFAYGTLTLAYQCLGRFEEARAVAERAVQTDVDLPYLRVLLYQVALALGDHATMERQVEWAAGRPTEHLIRREQAHAAASTGRMGEARALLQEAMGIAGASQFAENAGAITASAAMMEALTGDLERARDRAAEALRLSRNEVTLLRAGLVLGLTNAPGAQKVLDELPGGQHPVLPVPWVRAAVELGRGRPERTIEVLQLAARYEPVEGTPFSQYLRGQAYLQLDRPADAAREFHKLVERATGVRSWSPHSGELEAAAESRGPRTARMRLSQGR